MTPDRQALLKQRLAQKGVSLPVPSGGRAPVIPLTARAPGSPRVLSFAQERLWFVQQLQPANTAYHLGQAFALHGDLQEPALVAAFAELWRRHEVLRGYFPERDGRGCAEVQPATEASPLSVVDLKAVPGVEQAAEIARHEQEILQAPFDLAVPPLVRVRLLRLGNNEHRLLFCAHHIVFDGWSIDVLIRELGQVYATRASGGAVSPAATPGLQYADYAAWQRRRAQEPAWRQAIDAWADTLSDTPILALPTDRPRPATLSGAGAGARWEMPAALADSLRALAREAGVTVFTTLLAAWRTLLGRYSGQTDFAIGSPVANRREVALESMVGFFVNMVALRTDAGGDPAFRDLLKRTAATVQTALARDETPFEQIVDRLQLARTASHHPIFQVGFTYQHAPSTQMALAGVALTPIESELKAAKFDVLLLIEDGGAGQSLRGLLEYSTDLFEPETMQLMAENFRTLLQGIVDAPDTPISRLPLVSAAERARWPSLPSAVSAEADFPSLVAWFTATATAHPDRVAVTGPGGDLTYAELAQRSDQLAYFISPYIDGPDQLVGLVMERTTAVLVAILGILKAGGAYLPIDPAYPPERKQFMLADAQVKLVLTDVALRPEVVAPAEVPVVAVDEEWDRIAVAPAAPRREPQPGDTAYVIYTSGSTGRPKGVPVTHHNVVRLFTSTEPWFGFGPEEVWTLFHSFAFDFSVWEIWGALLYGGRLVVVPFEISRAVDRFHDLLVDEGVTVLSQTPSAFRQWVSHEGALPAPAPLALRWVVFGGEALDLQMLVPWFARHGDRSPRLVNMYGITETTVHVTYREIREADVWANAGSVIGEPIPDLSLHLLDAHLQPVPRGVPGEIVVGGAGVARGYLNRPELTAERFIEHPLAGEPGGRLYRSGDLARRLANGDLEYLGRIDFQVKVRGFRIELGEIESALTRHDAVAAAAVLARRDDAGETRLAAWLVAAGEGRPDAAELRRHLLTFLPDYMVPASFTLVAALPLTTNGKVDRAALPTLAGQRVEAVAERVAPVTEREQVLAGAWATVLATPDVGVTDNFFALGGDSIRSIEVRAAVRRAGWDFPLQDLFQHQTVRELAVRLVRRAQDEVAPTADAEAFTLVAEADRPRLPAGVVDAYPLAALQAGMVFHAELHPESPVFHDLFSYHLRVAWSEAALREALAAVTARHAMLRTSLHPDGFSEALQCVHARAEVPLAVHDLTDCSVTDQEARLQAWEEEEKRTGFAWGQAPLMRAAVHLRSDQTLQFSLSLHHAILDGWSLSTLLAELFTHYLERLADRVPPARSLPLRFRDFVALERATQRDVDRQQFWATELADPPAACLPQRAGRRESAQPVQAAVFHRWEAATVQGLETLAQQAGVAMKHVLLAAHAKVVAYLAGSREVITGVISNGRPEAEGATGSLGLFLNTVPYRLPVTPGTWIDLARTALAAEQRVLPHRRFPLAELLKTSGRAALFETSFNYVHFHVLDALQAREDFAVLDARYFDQNTFPYFAQFSADTTTGSLQLELRFDPAVLTREQAEAFVVSYAAVLRTMAQAPGSRHEAVGWLGEAERRRVVDEFNARPLPAGATERLHDGFLSQAAARPEAVALVDGDTRLSYGELAARVRAWAAMLRARGAGPERLVGVCLERGADLVTALLAVLESGAAYVPLDPSYPADRLAYMCEDAQIGTLISRAELAAKLPAGNWSVLDPVEIADSPDPSATEFGAVGANLAYLIYTSGSTGRPKATAIEHRQAAALVAWARSAYGDADLAGVLFSTSVCFDLSIFELFVTLASGGKVIVAENALALPELAARDEITLVNTVPSAAAEWVRQQAIPRSVRVVNLAGEPLSARLADQIYATETVASVFDLYGPSEDTTYSTWARRERGGAETIGRVLPGSQLYLLDEDLHPVPLGTVGEIFLGGAGVVRGYLGRPELTAERFVPDPFARQAGGRLYRTGDLARWREDGQLEFLGRRDHQVKIRGFRIELGEIKAVLEQHAAVREAAVVALGDERGSQRLIAYVAGQTLPGGRDLDGELRKWLGARLPEHFVPAVFVPLERLPLTPNGKLDRKALPPPPDPVATTAAEEDAPRNATEATLARVWAEVLKLPRVGIHDNYFALGGDSIQVLQLVARAKAAGLAITPRTVFEHPSVAQLALVAVPMSVQAAKPNDAEADLTAPLTLTPIQQWFFAQAFAEPHHWNQSILLQPRERMDPERLASALRRVVDHHPMLRARFVQQADGAWTARVAPASSGDLAFRVVADAQPWEVEAVCAVEQAALDLAHGPLVRAVWFEGGPGHGHRLFIVIHHLVIDGVSWRVLLEDLLAAYADTAALSPITVSSSAWARTLAREWTQGAFRGEQSFWSALAAAPVTAWPRDFPAGGNAVADAAITAPALSGTETRTLLRRALAAFGCQINDLLLAALAVTLREWSGQEAMTIHLEGHGREEEARAIDLSRSVGWFTALYPVRLDLQGVGDAVAAVTRVKAQLAAVPGRGLGYGVGRWLAESPAWDVPPAELCFNYLGQFDGLVDDEAPFAPAPENVGPQTSPQGQRPHLLDVNGLVVGGALRFEWHCASQVHREATIARLAQRHLDVLRELLAAVEAGTVKVTPVAAGPTVDRFDLAGATEEELDSAIEEIEF